MATLTTSELASLRRAVGAGVVPITWDKSIINAATQAVEDVLEGQAFDATGFVSVVTTTDARAQTVKDDVDGMRIPTNLRPIVEDWLAGHPPSVTKRSVNDNAIAAHVVSNMPNFLAAVSGMPAAQQVKLIRLVIGRRVEAVV